MDTPQDYKIYLRRRDGSDLDISDGTNFYSRTTGLHDYPSVEPVISQGYQSGAVDMGANPIPRQFSIHVFINAGADVWPVRNAAHNAARDALIRFLPVRGEPVTVRTEYIGSSGYWEIDARVQQIQWQEETPEYVASFIAPDPHLRHTVAGSSGAQSLPLSSVGITNSQVANPGRVNTSAPHGFSSGDIVTIEGHANSNPDLNGNHVATVVDADTFSIPVNLLQAGNGGRAFRAARTFVVDVAGNTDTYPLVTITPTQPKGARWNYMRQYTVSNPAAVALRAYPVALPFDFKWHFDNGRITGDGHDIRVIAGGLMLDRWFGSFNLAQNGGTIWVELDLPAAGSVLVQVVYGFYYAPHWTNATSGPMFDRDISTNAVWKYLGRFMDVVGQPSTHSWQWSVHTAYNQGMRAIQRHLPAPWEQGPSPAGSVNAAGGEVPVAANIEGYAGAALHHPLKFTSVQHSGRSLQDPATAKLTLRARDDLLGTQEDVWVLTDNTSGGLAAYPVGGGMVTSNLPAAREAVTLALRSLSVHTSPEGLIAGADRVYLTLAQSVAVSGNDGTGTDDETPIYMLEMEIENETTGNLITLFGLITRIGGVWQSVVLDLERKLLTMAGANFYYALSVDPDSYGDWLRLQAGQNSIRVRDEGVVGLDISMNWNGRRL